MTLYYQNLSQISFFPTVFPDGSEIDFHNNFKLIEELEPGETVSYVLLVPKIEGNWVFRITPSENSPQFFINPDKKPNSLKDYRYQVTASGA